MASVFELARGLAKSLEQSQERERMKRLGSKVKADSKLNSLLAEFRRLQFAVHSAALTGQQPGKEQLESLNKIAQRVNDVPLLREYLEAENAYGAVLSEVQQVLDRSFNPEVPGSMKQR